jgi:hypothetical protein
MQLASDASSLRNTNLQVWAENTAPTMLAASNSSYSSALSRSTWDSIIPLSHSGAPESICSSEFETRRSMSNIASKRIHVYLAYVGSERAGRVRSNDP